MLIPTFSILILYLNCVIDVFIKRVLSSSLGRQPWTIAVSYIFFLEPLGLPWPPAQRHISHAWHWGLSSLAMFNIANRETRYKLTARNQWALYIFVNSWRKHGFILATCLLFTFWNNQVYYLSLFIVGFLFLNSICPLLLSLYFSEFLFVSKLCRTAEHLNRTWKITYLNP